VRSPGGAGKLTRGAVRLLETGTSRRQTNRGVFVARPFAHGPRSLTSDWQSLPYRLGNGCRLTGSNRVFGSTRNTERCTSIDNPRERSSARRTVRVSSTERGCLLTRLEFVVWGITSFSSRTRLNPSPKTAISRVPARSPRVNHNRDRELDSRPRIDSTRSSSIDWE